MAQSHNSSSLLDTHKLDNLKLARVAIVHTEWNDKIVRELKNGCESTIHKYSGEILENIAVPGCFELPFACRHIWEHYKNKEVKPRGYYCFRCGNTWWYSPFRLCVQSSNRGNSATQYDPARTRYFWRADTGQ